jgi:hypothetical protein
MTQADRVHSTRPTNTSAKSIRHGRGFLAKAGGVSAAAAVAPAALAMTPRTFAMIEVHRAAEAAHMAACSEYSRRKQALIDEGIGLRPFTMLVSQGQPIAMRRSTPTGRPHQSASSSQGPY